MQFSSGWVGGAATQMWNATMFVHLMVEDGHPKLLLSFETGDMMTGAASAAVRPWLWVKPPGRHADV
jgi:hypothetical protein